MTLNGNKRSARNQCSGRKASLLGRTKSDGILALFCHLNSHERELRLWFMHGLPSLATDEKENFDHKKAHQESDSESSFHDWIIYELPSVVLAIHGVHVALREPFKFKKFMARERLFWYDKIDVDGGIFNSIFAAFTTKLRAEIYLKSLSRVVKFITRLILELDRVGAEFYDGRSRKLNFCSNEIFLWLIAW